MAKRTEITDSGDLRPAVRRIIKFREAVEEDAVDTMHAMVAYFETEAVKNAPVGGYGRPPKLYFWRGARAAWHNRRARGHADTPRHAHRIRHRPAGSTGEAPKSTPIERAARVGAKKTRDRETSRRFGLCPTSSRGQ